MDDETARLRFSLRKDVLELLFRRRFRVAPIDKAFITLCNVGRDGNVGKDSKAVV